MTAPGHPPAGWFPDPEDLGLLRYWDGAQWSEHRAPRRHHPPSSQPTPQATWPPGRSNWTGPPPDRRNWFVRHPAMTTLGAVFIGLILLGTAVGAVETANADETSAFDSSPSKRSPDASVETDESTPTPRPKLKPKPRPVSPDQGRVTLVVRSSGSRGGSITYFRPDKDTFQMSQDTAAQLPWRKTFRNVYDLPIGWNMNAQQHGDGVLTCIVEKDGKVIARNTSRGAYSVVTCSP